MGERAPLDLDPALDPWERQPRETTRAYELFLVFLDPGAPARIRRQRSVKRVSESETVSVLRVYQYSSLGRWAERARAYDAHTTRSWFDGLDTTRAALGELMVDELDGLLENLATFRVLANTATPPALLPGDYARHLNTAATVFRTVLGAAPEKIHHGGPEGGPVEIDWTALDQLSPDALAQFIAKVRDDGGADGPA